MSLLLVQGGAPPETITPDKWYMQHNNPVVRRTLATAVVAGSFFFGDALVPSAEAATKPEWIQPQSQPYFAARRLSQAIQSGSFFYGDQLAVEPQKAKQPDWIQPQSQPTNRWIRPTQNLGGEVQPQIRAVEAEKAKQPDWQQSQSQPVRRLPQQNFGGETRTEVVVAVTEVITLDKWYQPPSQPTLRPTLSQATLAGEVRVDVVVQVSPTLFFELNTSTVYWLHRDIAPCSGNNRLFINLHTGVLYWKVSSTTGTNPQLLIRL